MPYGSKSVVRPWSVLGALIAIPVFLVACGDDAAAPRDAGAIADAGTDAGTDGGADGTDAGACLEAFASCVEGGVPCCGEAVCFRGACSPPLGGTR
jgi:hypothetical protein